MESSPGGFGTAFRSIFDEVGECSRLEFSFTSMFAHDEQRFIGDFAVAGGYFWPIFEEGNGRGADLEGVACVHLLSIVFMDRFGAKGWF